MNCRDDRCWSRAIFVVLCVLYYILPCGASSSKYCTLQLSDGSSSSTTGSGKTGGGDGGNTSSCPSTELATAWYPAWYADTFPPSNISWSKYDQVTFAFATTTSNISSLSMDDTSQSVLPTFVSLAKLHDVKALLSIGGWTGSGYFSWAVGSAENRTTFKNTVLDLVNEYVLDGIDFDWEYPGRQGEGCNVVSSDDSANFLTFLQELREDDTGADLILTAAVSLTPFVGSDGEAMSDVSAFADVLDHIAIMNYDVWGSWSPVVGPNAPLNDSCAPSDYQAGSAVSAVQAWTNTGFPSSQITLGVASYGHSYYVTNSNALDSNGTIKLWATFNASEQPKGDSEDLVISSGSTIAIAMEQYGSSYTGLFNFWGLVQGGFLNVEGKAAEGIYYRYDSCSKTPFVYNATTYVMVSFDDATSFAAKGNWIKEVGLLGFAMWDTHGDYHNILLDSIKSAMGSASCDVAKRDSMERRWRQHARAALLPYLDVWQRWSPKFGWTVGSNL
ncbi:glycoside hydrolase [Fistulina hepatica ATCC 64428]|uniref:Glycoside hydrolase n=1 Tax=Fistulina hepatica ATCC 64428 TaxID=1128425 RepID=A0A0D7A3B3_9AGAR|nr:glycoside hydrolase [Fistulina hepatica ATCC 64428]